MWNVGRERVSERKKCKKKEREKKRERMKIIITNRFFTLSFIISYHLIRIASLFIYIYIYPHFLLSIAKVNLKETL